MKDVLIKEMYDYFEEEKETIKKTLLENMNVVVLEKHDDYGSLKLMLVYEKGDFEWEN